MPEPKDDQKAQALSLMGGGLGDREIARRVGVSPSSVMRWRRAAGLPATPRKRGSATQPVTPAQPTAAVAEFPPAPDVPFAEKVTAVRAVLRGEDPPDFLDEETFLRLARTLSSAENQHRMSQVRESGMGLTWDAALEVLRYALIAATEIFAPDRGDDAVQRTTQLANLLRARVMTHNERLAREL